MAATLAAAARTANAARAHAEADRDEVKEDRQDQRVARRLLAHLQRRDEWMNGADLRRALPSRDRPAFQSALDKLVAAGQVEPEDIIGPGQHPGVRYRALTK